MSQLVSLQCNLLSNHSLDLRIFLRLNQVDFLPTNRFPSHLLRRQCNRHRIQRHNLLWFHLYRRHNPRAILHLSLLISHLGIPHSSRRKVQLVSRPVNLPRYHHRNLLASLPINRLHSLFLDLPVNLRFNLQLSLLANPPLNRQASLPTSLRIILRASHRFSLPLDLLSSQLQSQRFSLLVSRRSSRHLNHQRSQL